MNQNARWNSEIYVQVCLFVCFWRNSPQWARISSFTRFLGHIQRRTIVGKTPLDEWPARRRDFYLTTHNTHKRETSISPAGFFFTGSFLLYLFPLLFYKLNSFLLLLLHRMFVTAGAWLRFEPTILAAERQQTYALDRAATGTVSVFR